MDYRSGLNQRERLADRMALALQGSTALHLGVAYAKSSGVAQLLRLDPPRQGRAVVGLGFGLTDPLAVEQLEESGFDVKVVPDGAVAASQFHPKLYLIEGMRRLTAISGSANLTGGGWTTNVEQFEELRFPDPSDGADDQRSRYEEIWDAGHELSLLRRSGDWEQYRRRARDRRLLERQDRKRLVRLQADTGQLVGALARRSTRAAPGYIGITNDDWWELHLALRDQADRALFWRRNTNDFKALAPGGVFFHLVKDPTVPEDLRAIRGFSVYPDVYEVGDGRDLFRRYGLLLGVRSLGELYGHLGVSPGDQIGVIHLEQITEFENPVPLRALRDEGISFARNIVSGKSLSLAEVALVFEAGGLGVPETTDVAAESREVPW